MDVVILWGLPGSGKTTYADRSAQSHYVRQIDGDTIRCKGSDLAKDIADYVSSYLYCGIHQVIIDSLVTTNDQCAKLIDTIIEKARLNQHRKETLKFHVIFWNEDREACIWNDTGRRTQSATTSIKNMPLECPSRELTSKYNLEIRYMTVHRKEGWKQWAAKYGYHGDDIRSDSWCLGGTYGNCWDDTKGIVRAEPQPTEFTKFDELLSTVCPNIGFMQYKKVYSACVSIKTSSDSDYYGGSTEYAYFHCELVILYEKLIETGLIERV